VRSAVSPAFRKVTANGNRSGRMSGKSQFLSIVTQSRISLLWNECFFSWHQKLRSGRVCWHLREYPLGRHVARAKQITLNSFRCPGLLNVLLGNTWLKRNVFRKTHYFSFQLKLHHPFPV